MESVHGLKKLYSYFSTIFSDSTMSKSLTSKNSVKGNTDNNNNVNNSSIDNKNDVIEKEKGKGNIPNEKRSIGKNEVKSNLPIVKIKKEEPAVIEEPKKFDKTDVKSKQASLLPVIEKVDSVELGKEKYDRTVSSERKMDRKKEKKICDRRIDKTNNERKSERKRERKRERRGGMGSNAISVNMDASNADKVNFIRGSKFKAVDIHKKLLVIKSDEDLKKLISKENVTEEDIRNLKAEIEKTDKAEEKKKKNIIIPGVQMCDNYNYITTKFQRPSHYIRYELYRDQVSGVRLNDGTIIHYDMLKEDETFLQKLNESLKIPVTDDDFSKLIDQFEKTTGKWIDGSEEINFKDALEIADELKLNYKNHVVKEIFIYWKKRRKTLGKPLLRMLWANCHHNLPNYIVFRPKVKEKMTLRKHKKKNLDTIIKMHKLLEDFRRIDKILKKMRQRDEKKLLLIQLNAILFDQTKNEIIDKTYVCPMWNYFKDYKMEKIYKRFKKDKFYKNVYTNSITNNAATSNTANNKNNHSGSNAHGESALDKVRNMKKNICGIKMDPFFFTYPLSPVEYENVVLIKRRGRNNRIWIDRKIVSDNNDATYRIGLFREEDAKHILKCCDVSEYFPDNFGDYDSISKKNDQNCKELSIVEEKEDRRLLSAHATASINLQKNDRKQTNICNGLEEKEDEELEEGEERKGDAGKRGTRKRARGKGVNKDVENSKHLELSKKIKVEECTVEKNVNVNHQKEGSSAFLMNNIEHKKNFNSFTAEGLNITSKRGSSTSTNKTEKQEENGNSLLMLNENSSLKKDITNLITSKSVDTPKSEMNKKLHSIVSSSRNSSRSGTSNINSSSHSSNANSSSAVANHMENTFNLYKKYNRSLFQIDEIMDPSVNRENSLLCLSRYAQEQKRFLFYLENLLNFDNFNFEHKKRRRKGTGKTAAKGAGKDVNQEIEEVGVKEANKEAEKCLGKGVNKGICKDLEKNTEKAASASRVKREPVEEPTDVLNMSSLLNVQTVQTVQNALKDKYCVAEDIVTGVMQTA